LREKNSWGDNSGKIGVRVKIKQDCHYDVVDEKEHMFEV
jgi:hypothetical protein